MTEHRGAAPSYDQMAVGIGLHSKSGVYRLIGGLEERGFVERRARQARSIEILRMPGDRRDPLDDLQQSARRLRDKTGTKTALALMADLMRQMADDDRTQARAVYLSAGRV